MQSTAAVGTALAWAELGGDASLPAGVVYGGPAGLLPARLPAMGLARASVAVCARAAAELAARRTGAGAVPEVRVDDGAVATAFVSERHLRVAGRPMRTFAPLSRFWRTADGWVRTHANYPHHRARFLAALGLADDGGNGGNGGNGGADGDDALAARVAAGLAERAAAEVEEAAYATGGLAVAVRDRAAWAAHPQGAAAAARPLLSWEHPHPGDAPPRPTAPLPTDDGEPLLPAAGMRVLDLTRVIAGPVATRTLALLGADVLRIDAPQLPESPDAHSDTGFGKRSALLDLCSPAERAVFEELLTTADVVVTGYRPGALDAFGLAPEALAARRPGLVVARLSAWGEYGPWGGRRGFDSLVQAACGIAALERIAPDPAAGADAPPGALPAQALDHATGYLLAAAVLRALTEQHDTGGTRVVRFALAQTAHWLLHHLPPEPSEPPQPPELPRPPGAYDPADWLTETASPLGTLRHARSPVSFAGGPANWSGPPGRPGADAPSWLPPRKARHS